MIKRLYNSRGVLFLGGGMKTNLLLVLLIFSFSEINANTNSYSKEIVAIAQGVIKGTVKDSNGLPVAGANVKVVGTKNAVSADINGAYQISASKGDVLEFSFIGMKTTTVKVGTATTINVKLEDDQKVLDEVVVVGYGTKTKAALTGSVAVVNSEKIKNRPAASLASSLQGLLTGLNIQRGDIGRVGREADNVFLEVRGAITRNGTYPPLVILDGITMPDGNVGLIFNTISPDDIESVTLLKDAQAAIYGSRGAGGVLLITTKKGKTSKPTITFNNSVSINTPGITRKQANILQAIDIWTQSYENDGQPINYYSHLKPFLTQNLDLNQLTVAKGPFPDTKDLVLSNNDWVKIFFGNGLDKNSNLTVSGRTESSNYYMSLGVLDQQSMWNYGNDKNRRYNARFKYEFDVTKWLKLRTNVALTTQKLIEPTDYGTILDINAQSYAGKAKYTQSGQYYGFGGYLSTIGWAKEGGDRTNTATFLNTDFEGIITPIKNLEITTRLAINRNIYDEFSLRTGFNSYTYDDELIFNSNLYYGGKDQVAAAYSRLNNLSAEIFANYKIAYKEHHFSALVGKTHEENDSRSFSASRNGNPGLKNNSLTWLGNGAEDQQFNSESRSDNALESIIGRVGYDYKNKYFLDGNFRRDGSSRFAPGHKNVNFYGAGASWVVSNEVFFSKLTSVFDLVKFRATYGELGNQGGIGNYDYQSLINSGPLYPFGSLAAPERTPSTTIGGLSSPDRTWEKTKIKNIGFDFSTLNHRLSGSFDYFDKDIVGAFYNRQFPAIIGITPPSINGASYNSKGWELTLNWKDKVGKDFNYSADLRLWDSKTRVTELADALNPNYGYQPFIQGYPVGEFFGFAYDGKFQTQAEVDAYKTNNAGSDITPYSLLQPGMTRYKDLNGDGKVTNKLYDAKDPTKGGDLIALGDQRQRFNFSSNLHVEYKGVFVNALFQGVGKWQVFDNNVAGAPFFRNPQAYIVGQTWTPTNTNALFPILSQNDGRNGYDYLYSDAPYKLKNAAYTRLKNLQIGYNLPSSFLSKIGLTSAQLYFSGTDLAQWSKNPVGFDPEKPYSIVNTPTARTFSFGFNLSL